MDYRNKVKKNGTVYLYENESYWNKENGYSTHKRTCIGKLGSDGKPIYNKYYKPREKTKRLTADANMSKEVSFTTFIGETPDLSPFNLVLFYILDNQ